ncbi:MAG: pyridoxamine 5'-phosphate oxidase family protein [Thermoleophilaceae bacterium]
MHLDDLEPWALELLREARVARLGYEDDDGRPRVLPVTLALHGGYAWSAIDHKPKRTAEPARLRHLRSRPEAALTADRWSEDWDELAWVQLLGRVEIVAASDAPEALAALVGKYEQYRGRTPAGPLLRLLVERALCWSAREL